MATDERSLDRSLGLPFLASILLALAVSRLAIADERPHLLDWGLRLGSEGKARAAPVLHIEPGEISKLHRRVHVVQRGDTLWGLATRFGGRRDPRQYVFELQRLNGLQGSSIVPGQELFLPP